MKPTTIASLQKCKQEKKRFATITAYDYSFAKLFADEGLNVMLVGDSLGMTVQGHDSTLPVTVADIAYHTAAVRRGAPNCLLLADLPFMAYATPEQAFENAATVMRAGANMVKIEGGAGKTTARNVVVETLEQLGIRDMVFTREPGGTQLAEKLRSLVLDIKSVGDEVITDKAEVLMFYAARVQLVETVIKPALANGTWVIGDRHDLSTQAYQGGGRGIDQHMLATLRDAVLGDFRPDLTLYLDVTPEVGLKRARARGELDRIEQESFDFFNRTRARYLELAAQDKSIHTIDATQPLEAVMDAIRTTVTNWVKELDA